MKNKDILLAANILFNLRLNKTGIKRLTQKINTSDPKRMLIKFKMNLKYYT